MKFLILAAGLSVALGFTYSAFTAGPYFPVDPNCKKNFGAGAEIGRGTRNCNAGPSCVQYYNLFNCQGYSYLRLSGQS
jgi:hypothetical protein